MASLDGGEHALAYPSGSAAIYALLHLLKPGDHFISCLEQYGGTRMLFLDYAEAQAMTVDFIDTTDVQKVEAAIRPNTKVRTNSKLYLNFENYIIFYIAFSPKISDDFH